MNQESKTLLGQFARALSNECIYGEGDNTSMKRWRELGAKTAAARTALEEHIARLESVAQATPASASGAHAGADDAARLRKVLIDVRNALQLANDTPNGGISDTLWMPDQPETVFDFIDAAMAAAPKGGA